MLHGRVNCKIPFHFRTSSSSYRRPSSTRSLLLFAEVLRQTIAERLSLAVLSILTGCYRCALSRQKIENRAMGSFWLIREEEMAGARNHDQLRAGASLRNQVRICRRHQPVRLALDHQRRSDDLAEAALCLPGEDSLHLRCGSFRALEPWPANC